MWVICYWYTKILWLKMCLHTYMQIKYPLLPLWYKKYPNFWRVSAQLECYWSKRLHFQRGKISPHWRQLNPPVGLEFATLAAPIAWWQLASTLTECAIPVPLKIHLSKNYYHLKQTNFKASEIIFIQSRVINSSTLQYFSFWLITTKRNILVRR